MNYQKLVLVGNVTKDAEKRTSKKGDVKFVSFSIAVGDGKGTTFFPVVLFDKYGESLASYLKRGRQVLVEGRVSVGEKGSFNVVAERVELGSGGKADEGGQEAK